MAGQDAPQSPGPFGDVCEFDGWPGVPVHAIAGRDDRIMAGLLSPMQYALVIYLTAQTCPA